MTQSTARTDRIADPIQMEVFSNRLLAIAEDMGSILIRSSFSSNIKERKDASTALFDARGRLVAQADHIPIHLGAMIGAVETILAKYPLSAMAPGDAFICNDPYLAGGSHLPDVSIITPIHHEGQVRFFAGNIAHHADVGGRNPGSTSGSSRSIFEEGIRIPVIRIARAGEVDLPTFPPFALFDPALGLTSIIPDMDPTRPAKADPRKLHDAIRRFGVTHGLGRFC
jgi:N-methylhydantoinase B